MQALSNIKRFFYEKYRLDPRALSLMRIGIALIVIADLCIRCRDLTAHYTDAGMWPRDILTNFGWKNGYWSLFLLNGSPIWALSLFIIHFIFAGFLLVGYQTRVSTIIVWLLYISLHNRNLFILQAGDDLLRLILLWGIFLPWQTYYSIDTRKPNTLPLHNTLANIGYLLLLASVYFFAAILKTSPEWYRDGSAVYYALSLDQLRLPGAGDWLYHSPLLMEGSNWLVLFVELTVPLLILLPLSNSRFRGFAFLLILLLHIGIGLTLYVGLFFIIGIVSAIGLLPSQALDTLEKKLHIRNSATKINPVPLGPIPVLNKMACSILIVFCLIINFSTAKWFNYTLRDELSSTANGLKLDQYWGMFAPHVLKKDGWMVYHGVDSIGRQWDLRLNQDYVDFSKPPHVTSMYKSDRWRKLSENMQGSSTFLRPLYCKYVLHQWNRQHPEKKITTLNLFFMQKENLADYKTTPLTKILYCVCIED